MSYDEDYSDPRQRCQHGTFIGSWWGPDYLCWACEEGISVAEFEHLQILRGIRSLENSSTLHVVGFVNNVNDGTYDFGPYRANLADALTRMVLDNHEAITAHMRRLRRERARLRLFLYQHRNDSAVLELTA